VERVDVRPITDVETLRAVEDLQQRVWGMPDRDVIPYHQLLAAGGAGGVILGAFVPDGTVVGFCYGFVGLREGRPILYSHMAGVAEQWRGTGVGFLLKRAQREAALTRGLDRIIWTFDALQAPNAHFNLHKLGAEARRYYVNYYGEMPDVLNRGLASDRLEVDWLLRTPRVTKLMGEAVSGVAPPAPRDASGVDGAPLALEASGDPLRPRMPAALPGAPLVRLAVPDDFAGVRHRDEALAQRWREATRLVFVEYFGRGYAAVDFLRSAPVGFYVLRASSAREGRAD
jgi:chorismate synthase